MPTLSDVLDLTSLHVLKIPYPAQTASPTGDPSLCGAFPPNPSQSLIICSFFSDHPLTQPFIPLNVKDLNGYNIEGREFLMLISKSDIDLIINLCIQYKAICYNSALWMRKTRRRSLSNLFNIIHSGTSTVLRLEPTQA